MPLVRAVTSPLPNRSFAVDPTRLLASETTPEMPLAPEAQVTAPAFTTGPRSQFGFGMT